MSSPESGSLTKVQEVALDRAADIGRIASIKARRFLAPHVESSLLPQSLAEAIADAEQTRGAQAHLEEILDGKHNDKSSRGLGLTAIIRAHAAIDDVLKAFKDKQFDFDEANISDFAGNKDFITLRLNTATYYALNPGLRFSVFASEAQDPSESSPIARIDLYGIDVARIEADGGEFWINRSFNYDGSPK